MKRNLQWFLELVIGRWGPSWATAVGKLGVGIFFPGLVLLYAIRCVFDRQALIITRGGVSQIYGLSAVSVGIAYACAALILYVHICWEEHPYFSGLRDAARQLLLLAIAVALVATFGLVLL